MPVTVAIYEKALARLAPRLEPLGLDLEFRPFTSDGAYRIGGATVAPSEVDVDYIWLSPDISLEGIQATAFGLVLDTRSIGVLQTFNAGLDHPAYAKVAARGVRICNSSAQAVAISEYVVAEVLAHFPPIEQRRKLQAASEWQRTPFREIARTNWLILGFGPIGQRVAHLAKAFGATTTVVRRSPATSDTVDRAGTLADLPTYLPDADVIVIACPLNEQTRGMADERFFAAVKPGAVLVNIARGAIIDDAALTSALDSERLAAAVLDVFREEPLPSENPLWRHPKIRVTAHTSFSGSGTRARWDDLFVDNIQRFVRGEPLANEVAPSNIL